MKKKSIKNPYNVIIHEKELKVISYASYLKEFMGKKDVKKIKVGTEQECQAYAKDKLVTEASFLEKGKVVLFPIWKTPSMVKDIFLISKELSSASPENYGKYFVEFEGRKPMILAPKFQCIVIDQELIQNT